jgi:hypothetical protein
MSRTFSLGQLMVGTTTCCLLCGLAVNYPQESLDIILTVSLMVPTMVVVLVLASASRQRLTLSIFALLGALLGVILAPAVQYSGPPMTWWQHYKHEFVPGSIPPLLGALVFGGTALLGERLELRNPEN